MHLVIFHLLLLFGSFLFEYTLVISSFDTYQWWSATERKGEKRCLSEEKELIIHCCYSTSKMEFGNLNTHSNLTVVSHFNDWRKKSERTQHISKNKNKRYAYWNGVKKSVENIDLVRFWWWMKLLFIIISMLSLCLWTHNTNKKTLIFNKF